MKPIGLGIVGLGGRAWGMAYQVRDGGRHLFEIVAVADRYKNKVDGFLKGLELPPQAGYPDHTGLIQDPKVEAVLVQTGTDTLAQVCLDSLRAGKHVMPDVPMIFTRQECWDLVVAVEKTGLVYCMAEQVRFANFVRQWKRHVETGDIGEPLFIQGEYIHPEQGFYYEDRDGQLNYPDVVKAAADPTCKKTWRNAFKHPIKYIPHELSPLLKIVDDRVTSVSCLTADRRMYGDAVAMLDCECALMQTAKGRSIRIINSFTAPRKGPWSHHWYHIMGTDGVLETARPGWKKSPEFSASAEMLLDKNGEFHYTNYGWPRDDAPFGDPKQGHGGLEAFSFQVWHDAIRGKGENELNIYTAVEAVLPGIMAAESAEAGGVRLDVPDVRPSAARPKGCYP